MALRKCTICDRRFKKPEHFKRHVRSHTKERPYECNICHKSFSRSDVLSRHAKSHDQADATTGIKAKDSLANHTPNRYSSAVSEASPMIAGPGIENGTHLFTPIGADAHQASNVSTPRDMSPSTSGVPHSPLDFLANTSAQHGRADAGIHPMLHGEQQQPFGLNEVPTAAQPMQQNGAEFEYVLNNMLQLWFEPCTDGGSNDGLLDSGHFPLMGDHLVMTPETKIQRSLNSGKLGGDNIPNERFSKVQQCWLAPANHTGRLMNSLWRDIVYTNGDNVFSVKSSNLVNDMKSLQGSLYGVDDDCRRSLQAAFAQTPFTFPQLQVLANGVPSPAMSRSSPTPFPHFPPADILDMALDLFFRTVHPLVPFVHLPTFSAKKTDLSLLYVMCLIGMMLMGTKGTATFVLRNFTHMLDKITSELARCTIGMEPAANTISIYATALLFLHLPVLTGDKLHLEQCQMLYVNLISTAQRHGLFAATEGQILDMSLFEGMPGMDMRWKAWSKVESTKRVIIGLLLLDSWYSCLLSTSPIIAPDSIQILMPCNDALFRVHSSMRWAQLICGGNRILVSTVLAPSENINVAILECLTDEFSIQAVLAMVQLRQSEACHRLLSNRATYFFAPCHTYAMDDRARYLPFLQSQILMCYGESLQLSPNALVMWHYICMTLAADIQVFELAAGRAGPIPARKALDDIAEWSQTPAARRACLHAAHIYKAMVDRKNSDHATFHSVFAVFSAALVLGLYTFMVPNSASTHSSVGPFDLMDDIDWQQVGTEGLTSFVEPRGIQSFSLDPAVNFIRNGASVYLRGVPLQRGYQSARRIFTDYASLLEDSGHWSTKKLSYVLHIMGDVLMDVE